MRADEFSIEDGKKVAKKTPPVKAKTAKVKVPAKVKESAIALPEAVVTPKSVEKRTRTSQPAELPDAVNLYGVEAGAGHELHRIRKHSPNLWAKIKNWD